MDAKSELYAWCMKRGLHLKFETPRKNLFKFESKVTVESFVFFGIGEATTKKLAEKNASQNFLDRLKSAGILQDRASGASNVLSKCSGNVTPQNDQLLSSEIQHAGRKMKKNVKVMIGDAKSFLCHWCQLNGAVNTWNYSFTGEPHNRIFTCFIKLESTSAGELCRVQAAASSKKAANHLAAKKLVKHLLNENLISPNEVKFIDLDLPKDEPPIFFNDFSTLKVEKPESSFQNTVQSDTTKPSTSQNRSSVDISLSSSSQNKSSSSEITDLTEKMDTLNMDTGNWDLGTAKSKLHQFLQENGINVDYTYSTDCYDLERYHIASMRFYVPEAKRSFRASGNARTRAEASKRCAFSLVKQLYRENLIEAYNFTLKKDRPMPVIKNPIVVSVPGDIVESIKEQCPEFGENVPELIPNESGSILLSSLPFDSTNVGSVESIVQPKYGGTRINWNPWIARLIQEDESNYNVSLRDLSANMKSLKEKLSSTEELKRIQWDRQNLPIFRHKEEILNCIDDHPVTIVKGSTGCGKSTQVCQYILDEAIDNNIGSHCNVVVIEPRRICATSLAERVAFERHEQLGQSVGYSVRFQSCFPRTHGAILFCTAGTFIRKLENGLTGISHIIVDEVHERTIDTDYILIILRNMLKNNSSLKLILMSANIDIDLFTSYFDGCPHISVVGSSHPVKDYFLEDCVELINFNFNDYQNKSHLETDSEDGSMYLRENDIENLNITESLYSSDTLNTLAQVEKQSICYELIEAIILWFREKRIEGSILVFLPGWPEIRNASLHLQASKFRNYFCILPLHSRLGNADQRKVFMQISNGKTKVILSTNLAESSVTIDDVVCVIDSCKTRISKSQNSLSFKFVTEWASKVNLEQRLGRAGRVKPGYCFRLCSKARYERLPDIIEPDIFRTPLCNVALSIKLLKLGGIRETLNSAIQPPQPSAIEEAERLLIELKCLDNQKELTPLGNVLARLPLNPRLGKMVMISLLFNCADQILKLAAFASIQEEFFMEFPTKDMSYAGKEWFSDHIAVLYALSTKREINHYQFSQKSSNSFIETLKAEEQLYCILEQMGFDLTSSYGSGNKNIDIVTALLCQGFYPNVCYHDTKRQVHFSDGKVGLVSNKSLMCSKNKNFNPPSPIFVFGDRNETFVNVCRNLTMVTPVHLLCFTNCKVAVEDGMVKLDDWLTLQMDPNIAATIMTVRSMIDSALLEVVADPTNLAQTKIKNLTSVVSRLCRMDFGKQVSPSHTSYINLSYCSYDQLHPPQRNSNRRSPSSVWGRGRGRLFGHSEYDVRKNNNNGCLWLRDAERI